MVTKLRAFDALARRYAEAEGIEAGGFDAGRIPAEAVVCHLALLRWWEDGGELSIGDRDRLRRCIAFACSAPTAHVMCRTRGRS